MVSIPSRRVGDPLLVGGVVIARDVSIPSRRVGDSGGVPFFAKLM